MKKLFVIFLSLCYLVLSSGFTQYAHLCKGTASKVYSFSNTQQQNQDKPCPICSAKEKGLKDQKKNCCKHVSKIIKLDDSVKKHNNFDFSSLDISEYGSTQGSGESSLALSSFDEVNILVRSSLSISIAYHAIKIRKKILT